jgi:hypothetical protein
MIIGNGAGGKRRLRRNVDVSDGGSAAERAVVAGWVDTPGRRCLFVEVMKVEGSQKIWACRLALRR